MNLDLKMTKLRAFSLFGGVYLLLLSAWVSVRYNAPISGDQLLYVIGIGIAVLFLPASLAYAKFGVRRALAQWGARRRSDSSMRIFVSSSPLEQPTETLDTIKATLSKQNQYDEIRREEFSDGPGLTVVYSTYHTLYVRILASGQLVVNGDSQRVDGLVETIDDLFALSLEQASIGSISSPEPIRGAPRAVLALCLTILVVSGTGIVVGVAYPSDAYNPAEKSVLVSLDLRSDVDPTTTGTQQRLAKAAFLITVLDEKSVEIAIVNNTEERAHHASDALNTSDHASQLLKAARRSASPSQLERIERMETNLDEAEHEVAVVLTEVIEETDDDETSNLLPIRNEFRRRANTSASTSGSMAI